MGKRIAVTGVSSGMKNESDCSSLVEADFIRVELLRSAQWDFSTFAEDRKLSLHPCAVGILMELYCCSACCTAGGRRIT